MFYNVCDVLIYGGIILVTTRLAREPHMDQTAGAGWNGGYRSNQSDPMGSEMRAGTQHPTPRPGSSLPPTEMDAMRFQYSKPAASSTAVMMGAYQEQYHQQHPGAHPYSPERGPGFEPYTPYSPVSSAPSEMDAGFRRSNREHH